jgi:hypothetical protein
MFINSMLAPSWADKIECFPVNKTWTATLQPWYLRHRHVCSTGREGIDVGPHLDLKHTLAETLPPHTDLPRYHDFK